MFLGPQKNPFLPELVKEWPRRAKAPRQEGMCSKQLEIGSKAATLSGALDELEEAHQASVCVPVCNEF